MGLKRITALISAFLYFTHELNHNFTQQNCCLLCDAMYAGINLLTLCSNRLPLRSTLKREATSKHIYVIYILNSFYSVVITCGSWALCARQGDRSPSWRCGTVCSNHVLSENSGCCRLSLRQDSTLAPTWRWICLAAPNSNGTWSREQVGEKFS